MPFVIKVVRSYIFISSVSSRLKNKQCFADSLNDAWVTRKWTVSSHLFHDAFDLQMLKKTLKISFINFTLKCLKSKLLTTNLYINWKMFLFLSFFLDLQFFCMYLLEVLINPQKGIKGKNVKKLLPCYFFL